MISTLSANPILFILSLFSLVVAITVHEFAHAKAADYLGDPTPRLQGRVTLNPMAHLDLYGMLFMVLVGFGWGKPVQFDPFNLKHVRRDSAIISFAGPLSNILMATLLSILSRLFIYFQVPFLSTIGVLIFSEIIIVNLMLAVFNMLPVHPLDGFKIVGGFLSDEQAREWSHLERYGIIFLLLLIIPFGEKSMLSTLLGPVLSFLSGLFLPFGSPLF
jgi:Zn-dependent protease